VAESDKASVEGRGVAALARQFLRRLHCAGLARRRSIVWAVLLLPAFAPPAQGASPVVVGTSYVLHSKVLRADRGYSVALPVEYGWSPDTRYPVLYVLDAQEQFAHVATTVAFMSKSGEIPLTIVVGVDAGNRLHDYTQTDWPDVWVGGGGASQFQAFLERELIPEIEGRWRTDGFRTLMGHSASGQFALHELATSPGTFHAWFVFSPSLDWDQALPQRELAEAFTTMKPLTGFVYFAWSDDFGGALADDIKLANTLTADAPQGLRCHVKAMPGETHVGITLQATIDALRALYPRYGYHPADLGVGLDAADAHYRALSKIVGWELPVPEGTVNSLGYAALRGGDVAQAIDIFQRNVQVHPLSANAHDSLADGLAAAERWTEAADAADRAADLANRYANPNKNEFKQRATQRRAEAKAHASKKE